LTIEWNIQIVEEQKCFYQFLENDSMNQYPFFRI